MLTELIYKLRGIDKWPETTATVTSIQVVSEGGRSGLTKNIYFNYEPDKTGIQSGKLFVDSNTSVYWLNESDSFDIQYKPKNPGQYYCKEAKSLSSEMRLFFAAVGVCLVILFTLVQFFSKQ